MKRFFFTALLLVLIAGGGYLWWRANAQRVVETQVRQIAARYCTNPEVLAVKPEGIVLLSLTQAQVKTLTISGKGLQLRHGPTLALARLTLHDLQVSLPALNSFSAVGGGILMAKVTDSAATEYLHTRGISISGLPLPVDSLKVAFSRTPGVTISGALTVAPLSMHIPLSASGMLVPSSHNGQVDFRIEKVNANGWSSGVKELTNALQVVNPVINLDEWKLNTNLAVHTSDGYAVVSGKITGVQPSLIP